MAKVIAQEKGYYGSAIRLPGDVFEAEGKASWFKPVKGSAKKDAEDAHKADAAEAKAEAKENETVDPEGDDGDDQDGGEKPKSGRTRKAKAEAAPDPVRVTNEIADLTGSVQPDWVQG